MPSLVFIDGETIRPGKILCVGRNYVEHAKELNNPVPKEPVFFLKPSTSLVPGGGRVELPRGIGRIDHEVELAVVMDDVMNAISPQEAASRIIGYAVFLDLTARDIQSEAKEKGMPWTVAKGYDGFAPISEIMRAEELVKGERAEKKEEEEGERAEALEKEGRAGDMDLELLLEVNGKVRQRGNTRDMLFSAEQLISRASEIMTLERGDIIATGTPAGVGTVVPGDRVVARIRGVGELKVEFV